MPRKLNTWVHVDGTAYGPDDDVPQDVAKRIVNPKVWDGEDDQPVQEQASSVKEPPRKGPGSGGPAWVEFAASKGVTQSFDSKEALIAHLEDNGHIDKA